MKKKCLSGIGIILLIAAAAMAIISYYNRELKLNYVEQIHFQNGYLYYVDRGDDNYFHIIRSDADGTNGEMITCARHEKEIYRRILQIFFDDKGNAYTLLDEINVQSYRQTGCKVFLCDFEEGKLIETDYDFTKIIQRSRQTFIQGIRQGILYYFTMPDIEIGEVKLYAVDEKQQVKQLDSILLEYPMLKSQFFLSDNQVLLWMDYEGEVFARKLGSSKYLDIDGITGVKGAFKSLADDGGHMAYVLDHQSDCIWRINLRNQKASVEYEAEEIKKQAPEFTFQHLLNPDCTEEGFCGGIEGTEDESAVSICSLQEGMHRDVDTVTLTPAAVSHRLQGAYCGILVAAALLCLYWRFYCRFHVQTILLRIVLLFVLGLMFADEVLERWIEQTLREQLERNQIMALSVVGGQLRESITARVEGGGELLTGKTGLVLGQGMDGAFDAASSQESYTYSILKADENGDLRIYESISEYRNVPAAWYYTEESYQAVCRAYESGKNVNESSEGKGGKQDNRFTPIVLSDGSVYGVLAITASGNLQDYQIWYYQWNLKLLSAGLLFGITILLVLILEIFLRPLKKLKACAGRLAGGEMGVTMPVRGHDEVADISEAFNQMSLGIARFVQDIQDMSDAYYKFIPAKSLELLGKESIQQVKLGDEITENMTVMSFHTMDYQRMASSAETVFTEINQLLSMMVEPIDKHHGVVEAFEDSGLKAFFTVNSKEALDAAVEIHKSLDRLIPDKERTIGISYGFLMLGVIGHEKRMEVTAVSAYSKMAEALGLVGDKYGARILITHRVYSQIPDFEEQYHARYIGNVYLTANDMLERVYDVYDGDTEEDFYEKERTKPLFEKGVELFAAKKFYEARLIFVEVLKRRRRDKAAKEYLYRCDKYYRLADKDGIETVIEKF